MTTISVSKPKTRRRGHPQTNPNSLANLIPYKKGQNGHGGYPLKVRLQHALDKPLQEPAPDAPVGEQLVYSTIQGALLREPAPFHEVWDRVEGKLSDQNPREGNPITNNFLFVLPDGTKLSPKALIGGANGNRDRTST